MKKLIAAVGLVAALALTGCSTGTTNSNDADTPDATAEAPAILDLNGEWEQANKNSDDNFQAATIADGVITVNWVAPDTKSIYWIGTIPADATDEAFTWTSAGDTEAMASALLASQDATKDFSYDNGVISYEVTALGTTTTVKLERK